MTKHKERGHRRGHSRSGGRLDHENDGIAAEDTFVTASPTCPKARYYQLLAPGAGRPAGMIVGKIERWNEAQVPLIGPGSIP